MSAADSRRRKRRLLLLISAIVVPSAVVILLVFRVVRQENELSERRSAEARREGLDQLRRELSARLQAVRLEEVNRLIGESGRRLPPESAIVFVAPMMQDRMVLPWEDNRTAQTPAAEFAQMQSEGESLEFQRNDAAGAAAAYRRALKIANTPSEKCSALLWLGRAYRRAGEALDADRADRATLHDCGAVPDNDGISHALYAADRLLTKESNDAEAQDYIVRVASIRQWRTPNEAYMLQSLLRKISSPAAVEPLRRLSSEIHDIDLITALAQNMDDHLGKLQRAFRSAPGDLSWMGYGDEPWLITIVSPTSFAAPVVMAVSSRKVVPEGVTLRLAGSPGAVPLGDGFLDLQAEWPASRFAVRQGMPFTLYGSVLFVVLGIVLLGGYLLLRDVHREAETVAMRSHFVASVSHELKTPLTSIRAHAETLLMGRADTPETTSEYLKTIMSESERLTRLVESVLDLSRIEQGRKSYRMQSTYLGEVVRSAAKTMEYPLSQLGFTLTISSDDTEPTLLADADALEQAILNLLGNAMKYSGGARRIEMRMGSAAREAFVDVVDHG
ncbi:MAG TPA: histidine kinase dimerization/phospho-acceptor domain-containing protein, partial [Terriglobia bacterium]|nr:histidine kinase dimerization/phospho-acceptor domain-containing protein [Terriglobia bacterium]